jgi:outer membrane protein OmpA-like peptidoglycan-associated protein
METLEIAHEGLYVDYTPEPVAEPEPEIGPPEQIDAPPVQFEYNSAELTSEGAQVCKEVAEELDRLEIEDIWVEGHTCTMGSFAYNQSLSDQRAYSVVKELKAQSSDSTRRYNSLGFSWKYPVASNATTAGKESNRRTEFMTSSWTDRGWDGKRVTPEEQKNSAPWNHR